jgi:hypothetical protein
MAIDPAAAADEVAEFDLASRASSRQDRPVPGGGKFG